LEESTLKGFGEELGLLWRRFWYVVAAIVAVPLMVCILIGLGILVIVGGIPDAWDTAWETWQAYDLGVPRVGSLMLFGSFCICQRSPSSALSCLSAVYGSAITLTLASMTTAGPKEKSAAIRDGAGFGAASHAHQSHKRRAAQH
jgi:hypothetical protein